MLGLRFTLKDILIHKLAVNTTYKPDKILRLRILPHTDQAKVRDFVASLNLVLQEPDDLVETLLRLSFRDRSSFRRYFRKSGRKSIIREALSNEVGPLHARTIIDALTAKRS